MTKQNMIHFVLSRDPTDDYFRKRYPGGHDVLAKNLGPYHAGLEPYHDIDLPDLGAECDTPGGLAVDEEIVPYTAIAIMFIVLVYSSVTSWTSSPAKVKILSAQLLHL